MAAGIPLSPTQPADPYAWAVQQATRDYPRIAEYPPMRLTYNPKREGSSDTFGTTAVDDGNPFPGNWTVEMGNSPYYRNRATWPGLVALESLHMMQAQDPRYQSMVSQLQGSLTPFQQKKIRGIYDRSVVAGEEQRPYEKWLPVVQMQEMIRDRMFGPYFHQYENAPAGGWNEYQMTPEQQKMVDAIDRYMRTTGR